MKKCAGVDAREELSTNAAASAAGMLRRRCSCNSCLAMHRTYDVLSGLYQLARVCASQVHVGTQQEHSSNTDSKKLVSLISIRLFNFQETEVFQRTKKRGQYLMHRPD